MMDRTTKLHHHPKGMLYKSYISNAPINGKLERGTLDIIFQTIDFLKQFVKSNQSS